MKNYSSPANTPPPMEDPSIGQRRRVQAREFMHNMELLFLVNLQLV